MECFFVAVGLQVLNNAVKCVFVELLGREHFEINLALNLKHPSIEFELSSFLCDRLEQSFDLLPVAF